MEHIIVATFINGADAIEGLHKISELEEKGDISVYDKLLIREGSNDEYEIFKEDNTNGWQTIAGMAFGELIGSVGGPVGLAIGLYTGTVIGAVFDYTHYSFDQDFVETITKNIQSGSTSIIAEVDDASSVFIDEYLKPLDAVIWRSNVYEEHDKFVEDQTNSLQEEIQLAESELVSEANAQKAIISAKVAELRNNRNEKIAEIDLKSKELLSDLRLKTEANRAKLHAQLTRLENRASDEFNLIRLDRTKQKLEKYDLKIHELNKKLTVSTHANVV